MPKAILKIKRGGKTAKFDKVGRGTPFMATFPGGLSGFTLGEEVTYTTSGKKITIQNKKGNQRTGELDDSIAFRS